MLVNKENLSLKYNFKETFKQLSYCIWGDRIIHVLLGQSEKTNFLFFWNVSLSSIYNLQSTLWIQSSWEVKTYRNAMLFFFEKEYFIKHFSFKNNYIFICMGDMTLLFLKLHDTKWSWTIRKTLTCL